MDGPYAYDFSPINIITDGDGINVSLWTKQELIAYDASSNEVQRSKYGYKIRLDAQEIANANPQLLNAKYMSIEWSDIRQLIPYRGLGQRKTAKSVV